MSKLILDIQQVSKQFAFEKLVAGLRITGLMIDQNSEPSLSLANQAQQ